MTIKLVAIDMDATLLRDDKTYDVERFNAVSKQLTQQGVTVCIATGNSANKMRDYFDEERREYLYLAGDNGNHVFYQDRMLLKCGIDPKTFLEVVKFFESVEGFTLAPTTNVQTYMIRHVLPRAAHYIRQYNNNIELVDQFDFPEGENVVKLAIVSEHSLAYNKQIVAQLNEKFPTLQAVTSGEMWVDVFDKKGGKGAAVQYLQEKLGVTPDETMAFGDSLNDATMMKRATYSVAMGNADDDLAQLCRYQIGTNNDQAVVCVLEHLLNDSQLTFMEQYSR